MGRVKPHDRLKVTEIAKRFGSSTNPVREALQQLCGEGFVVMTPNRGARVRPMDENFVRDIVEIEMLLEPKLTSWFVEMATSEDLAELEAICGQIEDLNFQDSLAHNKLDMDFHLVMYKKHYNQHALELWRRHRDILSAISQQFPNSTSLKRQKEILEEHRLIIKAVREQDIDQAVEVISKHVDGAGKHVIEQIRLLRNGSPEGLM
ncbi:GntR family transcriptional regulator [Pseudovibrio japonicus]|uniref:GntR family transcriptional regulator n=1 Tax=Pseudovibrio japonicus TaxID=366534 RepID=A0ABQ3EMA8_9HYPH|nr:GntR family transcriptional regulator [Pseudovibrio japonicus]